MFVDRVKIHVKGGDGGDGKVSFYRAKYITHGGPDGGDGGKGGNVVFVGESGMSTLMDFRYKRKFVATPGEPGGKRNCFGKDGEDIIIKVPVGTVIREAESGKVMADITTAGEEKILIHGGKGGKGGDPGSGGKILQATFDVTPAQKFSYVCGVGGFGAAFDANNWANTPNTPGAEGTKTTFGSLDSSTGSTSDIGYTDPVTGEVFAAKGEQGIAGGDGAGSGHSGPAH